MEWRVIHEALVERAAVKARSDHDEARELLAAYRAEVHSKLGYGSFVEYVERLFGYSPRQTEERLRVARELEDLPGLGAALRDHVLNQALARSASPGPEATGRRKAARRQRA